MGAHLQAGANLAGLVCPLILPQAPLHSHLCALAELLAGTLCQGPPCLHINPAAQHEQMFMQPQKNACPQHTHTPDMHARARTHTHGRCAPHFNAAGSAM